MLYRYKVALIGDHGVGKSSLVNSLLYGNINYMRPTIGISFFKFYYTINEDKIELDIWDTAGQERYFSLVKLFYRNSDAIFFVYDLSNTKSYHNIIHKWIPNIDINNPTIAYFIGNKLDLVDPSQLPDPILLTSNLMNALHSSTNPTGLSYYLTRVFTTSALKYINIKSVFTNIAIDLYNNHTTNHIPDISLRNSSKSWKKYIRSC